MVRRGRGRSPHSGVVSTWSGKRSRKGRTPRLHPRTVRGPSHPRSHSQDSPQSSFSRGFLGVGRAGGGIGQGNGLTRHSTPDDHLPPPGPAPDKPPPGDRVAWSWGPESTGSRGYEGPGSRLPLALNPKPLPLPRTPLCSLLESLPWENVEFRDGGGLDCRHRDWVGGLL